MLVSALQQSESATCVHMSPPSWTSLPFPAPSQPSKSSQSTELGLYFILNCSFLWWWEVILAAINLEDLQPLVCFLRPSCLYSPSYTGGHHSLPLQRAVPDSVCLLGLAVALDAELSFLLSPHFLRLQTHAGEVERRRVCCQSYPPKKVCVPRSLKSAENWRRVLCRKPSTRMKMELK